MPDPNAVDRIPRSWSTVDRVLDVWYRSKSGEDHESVQHRNYRKLPDDPEESIKLVSECYFKWGDLPYSSCELPCVVDLVLRWLNVLSCALSATTEAPPEPDEDGYAEYVAAYKAFLVASSAKMRIPVLGAKQLAGAFARSRFLSSSNF